MAEVDIVMLCRDYNERMERFLEYAKRRYPRMRWRVAIARADFVQDGDQSFVLERKLCVWARAQVSGEYVGAQEFVSFEEMDALGVDEVVRLVAEAMVEAAIETLYCEEPNTARRIP